MNVQIIIGNLGADPELRYTGEGKPFAKFRVAVERYGKDPDWFAVVVFGKQADACANHLHKGSQVAVRGSTHLEQWEKDGDKRSTLALVADDVRFIGGRKPEAAEGEEGFFGD